MMDTINNVINNKSIDTYKIIEDRYNTLSRYLLKYFDSHDVMTRQDVELIIQSLENKSFEFVSLYADGEKVLTDINVVEDEN